MWKSVKNWLQEWVFNIYKWKWGRSRWIAYFENYLQKWFGDRYGELPTVFPTRISRKISHKIFPQEFPTRFFRKNFPQDFPTRFSHKIFPSWILIGWLPITLFQMLNFHQSLPFLNWLFALLLVLQEFPTRFSHKNFLQEFPARFSHKIFPQEFPTRFSCKNFPQDFPKLDPDWSAPHHPIPNAKFPPITALLNTPTYHKRSKVSPPPFPQILWEPQINE